MILAFELKANGRAAYASALDIEGIRPLDDGAVVQFSSGAEWHVAGPVRGHVERWRDALDAKVMEIAAASVSRAFAVIDAATEDDDDSGDGGSGLPS